MTEIGHGLLAQPTGAPVAEVRPRRFSVHGQEITDPYAWLKAENWQTVLKDPAALPDDIAAYLKAENAFAERALEGDRGAAPAAGRRDARADPGGRERRPGARRAVRLLHAPPRGRAAPADLPASGDRARRARIRAGPGRDDPHRRRPRGRGPAVLRDRRRGAFRRPCPARLERRHQGIGTLHDPRARHRHRPRPRRPGRGDLRRGGLGGGRRELLVRGGRRQPPARQGHAPPPRHPAERGRDDLHGADAGYFVHIGKTQSGAFLDITASDHETSEVRLLDRHAESANCASSSRARRC